MSNRGNFNADQIRDDNKHGAGTLLQTSDGTGASGNLAKFASDGTTTDSGIAASSISGGITALTGDVTATGPGSVAATLAAAGTAGTYTKVTTDSKGRVTSGTTLVAADIPALAESAITNLVSDLAAKAPTARLINTTAPLTGGGDLTADRTLAVSNATSTSVGVVKPDGTTITVSAGVITAVGAAPSGAAGGDLSGSYPNPTLAAAGTAGTYTKVTTDSKGRVTSGTTLTASDVPNIAESQVTNLTSDLAAKAAIASLQQEAYVYAADTGSANAYAVSLSPAPTIVAGSEVVFKAAHANTGASTIAVNGAAAIALVKNASTPLASGDVAAGQIITARYDGTNYQITSAAGGSSGITALTGDVTASGSGSVAATLAGTAVTAGSYTNTNLTVDAKGRITAASNGTGSSTSPAPALRGTAMATVNGSSLTVTLPSGSAVGDLIFAMGGHAAEETSISGSAWSIDARDVGQSYVNGFVAHKVLSATDVTTGSVTVTFNASGEGAVALAVFVGALGTAALREFAVQRVGGTFTSPVTGPTTTANVVAGDSALYFTMNRGASTDTVNRGTLKQTVNDGSLASGCLYSESLTSSGAVQPTFSYTSTGQGYYEAVIIVKNGPQSALLIVTDSSTQTVTSGFNKLTFNTVVTDNDGGWSTTNNQYTIPITGYYLIVTKLRIVDSATSAVSYGQGANSSAVDGSWFAWFVTNPQRNGSVNTRFVHLAAGTVVLMYAYANSSLNTTAIEMNIALITAG